MKLITGNKIGSIVNFVVDGNLYTKDCGTSDAAKEMFKLVLKAKKEPTEENIQILYGYLNKNIRIAKIAGFEFDVQTGETFMEGFNTPVPELLMNVVEDYIENDYPLESIINFWKLLMANPDKRVRESLFKFIHTHNFVLTDKGYMIVYKAVNFFNENNNLDAFISDSIIKVKKSWKTSPRKYVVYKQFNKNKDFEYKLTKKSTFETWNIKEKNVELVGSLDNIVDDEIKTYTPIHVSGKGQKIILGEAVSMNRTECDSDPAIDCSFGLHVGAAKYVENFGGFNKPVLVCLINPMHVVAVPDYDHSKMRVSEYFPFGLAERIDGKIKIIEQPFFEHDYVAHEEKELAKLLRTVKEEDIRQAALNAPKDDRPLEDYISILESRVISLSN